MSSTPSGAPMIGREWVTDFIEELARFPSGAHDDDVDAFSQLVAHWRRKGTALTREMKRTIFEIDETGADHSVKVVTADQGPDADSAAASASKLVHSDGASCLTGPWGAEAFLKAAETIAVPSKVLAISPTPDNEETTDLSDHDLVDSTALPVSLEGKALANAISDDLGGTDGNTVNVAASSDTYGDSLAQGFIEAWQGDDGTVGGQVVISPPPLSSGSSSSSGYSTSSSSFSSIYSSQVSQLVGDSPDAVLLAVSRDTLVNMGSALGSSYSWDPETAWGSDPSLKRSMPALTIS